MLTKKSFFSSFFVVFNQMLFHFQINLTQRPVLHLYNDLINEAFQNVKGGSRINIEKELERYSKYSRSKTMFDYWPKDCWYTGIYCYMRWIVHQWLQWAIRTLLYRQLPSIWSELPVIFLSTYPYIHVHVLDGMKSCYVNMILMLCKYMFTCLFLRYHLSLGPTNIVLMYNLTFIVVYDVCDQYIVLWKYNGKFIWYSVKVKACWCYKYGTQFSCLFKVLFLWYMYQYNVYCNIL